MKNIKIGGSDITLELDSLNCGSITIHDRDSDIRFVITVNNNVTRRFLSLDITEYDKDDTVAADRLTNAAVSYNEASERTAV